MRWRIANLLAFSAHISCILLQLACSYTTERNINSKPKTPGLHIKQDTHNATVC